eukprot:m.1647563 g.1647563  ORF g.1647563 m.1647563 type:complete len:54 (+) comp75314_c0_seq1:30-191(+)
MDTSALEHYNAWEDGIVNVCTRKRVHRDVGMCACVGVCVSVLHVWTHVCAWSL